MRGKSTIVPTLVLGLVCLGQAGIVYWQTAVRGGLPNVVASDESALPEENAIPDDPEVSVPPREQFLGVVARPLFSPTRRPAEQGMDVAQQPPSEVLDIDLLGIVIWRSLRLALIRPRSETNVMRVAVGGMVSGWTVAVIEPYRVMFRQGESEQEFRLAYKTGAAIAEGE